MKHIQISVSYDYVYNLINAANQRQLADRFLKNIEPEYTIEATTAGLPWFGMRHYGNQFSNVVQAIQDHPSKVVVLQLEGLHFILDSKSFSQLPADKKYIIFSSMYWDTAKYPFHFEYILVQHDAHWWYKFYRMFNSHDIFWHFPADRFIYKFEDHKPYQFLAHIGMRRPDRGIIVDIINEKLEHRNFIGSYQGHDFGAIDYKRPDWEAGFVDAKSELFQQYSSPKGFERTGLVLGEIFPIETYNLARFQLVVESVTSIPDCRFITEKTMKPVFAGMPFVVFGLQYHLKHLRDLYGFKTYNELWDEGYDEIRDPTARARAVVDLCNQLQTFDWKAAESKLKEIAAYNFRNMLYMREVYSDQSVKELGNIYNFINDIK
jgi:hypothetical protein